MPGEHQPVLVGTGRYSGHDRECKRFRKAAADAGLRPVRFHDLRHTFGTRMAAAGAPIRSIQEWMGHSDTRTTQRYADYAPDPTQGAMYAARAFGPTSPTTGGSAMGMVSEPNPMAAP